MTLPDPVFWLVAAAANVCVAAVTWWLGRSLQHHRRLPRDARGYWSALWLLAVTAPLVVATVQATAPAGGMLQALLPPLPLPTPLPLDVAGASPRAGAMDAPWNWSQVPMWWGVAVAYLAGVAIALQRLVRGAVAIRHIVCSSRPLPHGSAGPRLAARQRALRTAGIRLLVTSVAITPFAVCWPARAIVLPARALDELDDRQVDLIVRHETAHLHQRDPQRAALMAIVGAVCWFNPFLRRIVAEVQLATELRCDAAALATDPEGGRALATAYVFTLRMQARAALPSPLVAMSHAGSQHQLRVRHMLAASASSSPRTPAHSATAAIVLLALISLPVLALAVAQAHMAAPFLPMQATAGEAAATAVMTSPEVTHGPPSDGPRPGEPRPSMIVTGEVATGVVATGEVVLPAPAPRLHMPIATARVTGHYGDTGSIRSRPHRGMDFGARRGTPVLAPADGVVQAATTLYENSPEYGTVIVLDHGAGWQSLYAHLDGVDVAAGQRVRRGEQIGRVGRTGKVTGPHLHLEVLSAGQRVDPAPLLH